MSTSLGCEWLCVHICIYVCWQVHLCRIQWQTELGWARPEFHGLLPVILSQKHPLQAVNGHAAVILRVCIALGVGAAGRGALWGAQVVHEGQPVLSTEVHKFNLAHTWIKVHAWRRVRERAETKPGSSCRSVTCIHTTTYKKVLQ